MKISGKILGLAKFKNRMKELNPKLKNELKSIMARGLMLIEGTAKQILTDKGHVLTGNLRRNIKHKTPRFINLYQIEGVVGTDVPYAPYIEALPDGGYLLQAITQEGDKVNEYIKQEFRKILK